MNSHTPLERRLRVSGLLVILGLLVEALCLLWSRPIAFVVFIGVGGGFLAIGIMFYLFSLVSAKGRL